MTDRTFTQREVDELVQVRLSKQRKRYERQLADLRTELAQVRHQQQSRLGSRLSAWLRRAFTF